MHVRFLQAAESEFRDAVAYYNGEREGLGFEFAAEVVRTVERIVAFPDAWPVLAARARRARTGRFPYGVLYQVRSDGILILAVMHMHRDPIAWRERLR